MSERAEGCGQWLSTKEKLSRADCKKARQKDGLKRQMQPLVSRSKHKKGAIEIVISSSPLSPRTRKRLENAKQSKIDRFFDPATRSKASTPDEKITNCTTKHSFGDVGNKIQLKRRQEYLDQDSGTWTSLNDDQVEEKIDLEDCNVSGVSCFSDSCEEDDEYSQNCLYEESLPDKYRESLNPHICSPPNKKLRTSESTCTAIPTESDAKMSGTESQPFCFTQWARKQVMKCKQIQEGNSTEESSLDLDSLPRYQDDFGSLFDAKQTGTEFSETPPFEFTQWAKQQVEVCRKIQMAKGSQRAVCHQSTEDKLNSLHHTEQGCKEVGKGSKSGQFSDNSESEFHFSEWVKDQEAICKNLQKGTENMGTEECESEKWDNWKPGNGKSQSVAHLSDESGFQFSEWVKSQVKKCKRFQEDSEES